MRDVLNGFATIWMVIGVGWVLADRRILDERAQDTLSRVSFFVGSPALLFLMLAKADLGRVFSENVIVTVLATCSAGLLHLLLASTLLRASQSLGRPELVLGTACACYVNAANLGLPIAAFVLKDASWVAPVLLLQVGVLQPLALSLLDADLNSGAPASRSPWAYVSLPFRNPMTVGTLAGLVVNVLGLRVPTVLSPPLELLAALSIPGMLLAFGMSLRTGPLPGKGPDAPQTALAVGIKLLVHPLIAWGLAVAFQLPGPTTLAVVVLAGLPTAQNVFVWASRYGRGVVLVRDAVFITTIASLPTVALFSALVH
ncbi:AEC family transporter [Aestuariimicrobium sp. p3-SID1156]|uniref:AEC family transporter n=1 Tax=Aestuariimicrobium sp. p3-SID1156 TaxID=2916038 RepID=UPI00223B2EFD|nr:AEC family transporter [Aestuariimicrobium sp. p3-SID1156]MCT1459065.1 AEC family transporter [Aestuariimicrobium sp. p3-SID1156]